jgi:hypothetical protein
MQEKVLTEVELCVHQWVCCVCHLHDVAMVIICRLKHHIQSYKDSMTGFKLEINGAPAPHTLFELCNRDILRSLVGQPALVKRIESKHKEAVRTSSKTASIEKLILSRNFVKDLQKYSASYSSKGVRTKYKFGKGAEIGRVYPDGPVRLSATFQGSYESC